MISLYELRGEKGVPGGKTNLNKNVDATIEENKKPLEILDNHDQFKVLRETDNDKVDNLSQISRVSK